MPMLTPSQAMNRLVLISVIWAPALASAQFGLDSAAKMMLQPAFLVQMSEVRKELKTTKDQNKLFDSISRQAQNPTDLSQAGQQFEANDKAVLDALDDTQRLRLKQIRWQIQKGVALADPEIANALKLTEGQSDRVKEIRDAAANQASEWLEQRDFRKLSGNMKKLTAETSAQLMALLTPDQTAALKTQLGKSFKTPKSFEGQLII